jgi:FkbM family methyltransferase
MKEKIKNYLMKSGFYVKRAKHVPAGCDWAHDINRWIPKLKPEILFDIGANVGQTCTQMAASFPNAAIHSFEPIKETFALLVNNTSSLPNTHCHNCAMGSKSGSESIVYTPYSLNNSLKTGVHDNEPDAIEARIDVKSVDEFCEDHWIEKIDLLKTDTEGYDLEVLKGCSTMLSANKIFAVLSEVTFDEENTFHTQFGELNDYLSSFDFLVCCFYDTRTLMMLPKFGSYCNALWVKRDLLPTLY